MKQWKQKDLYSQVYHLTTNLVEIIELPEKKFFVAGQFHPELVSRPQRPQPLFREFVGAAFNNRK